MSKALYVPRTFQEAKRFTDAELSAEFWRSYAEFHETTDKDGAYLRAMTFKRFATTPSYDEVDS